MSYMIRNVKETQEQGVYDCEVENPKHGWIPFTANASDVELYGRSIVQLIEAGAFDGEITPYDWQAHWMNAFESQRSERLNSAQLSNQAYDRLSDEQKDELNAYTDALESLTHDGSKEFAAWPDNPEFI